jgi:hypothetical protein
VRLALHGAGASYVHAFNTTMLLTAALMAVVCAAMYLMLGRPHDDSPASREAAADDSAGPAPDGDAAATARPEAMRTTAAQHRQDPPQRGRA